MFSPAAVGCSASCSAFFFFLATVFCRKEVAFPYEILCSQSIPKHIHMLKAFISS